MRARENLLRRESLVRHAFAAAGIHRACEASPSCCYHSRYASMSVRTRVSDRYGHSSDSRPSADRPLAKRIHKYSSARQTVCAQEVYGFLQRIYTDYIILQYAAAILIAVGPS